MSDPDELLDIKEAARLLRVSATSLRRWTNSGALAHVRIGGKRERRFRKSDLLRFLDPAPAARAESSTREGEPGSGGFHFDGWPMAPGTHLCGLSTSESARIAQAAGFLVEGLRAGSVCLVIGPARTRRRLMKELARRVPSLDRMLESGRLAGFDHLTSARAQLDRFEAELGRLTRAGAESFCVAGDLSLDGPEYGKAFARTVAFEAEYERRIARRFPVVSLCQYDARRLSGRELLATIEGHPDVLRYPGRVLLATGG